MFNLVDRHCKPEEAVKFHDLLQPAIKVVLPAPPRG